MHVWYADAGIEDTPEPVYTHCLVLFNRTMTLWGPMVTTPIANKSSYRQCAVAGYMQCDSTAYV